MDFPAAAISLGGTESDPDFNALFESAPVLVFTQDLEGRITRVNRAFETITGYTRAEGAGMRVLDLIVPEHRRTAVRRALSARRGAAAEPFEIDIVTRSGQRAQLEVSVELVFSEARPVAIQGFARDITHRKQTEAQLAAFTRNLRVLHRLSTANYRTLDELFSGYISAGCEIFAVDAGSITREPAPSGSLAAPIVVNGSDYGHIWFRMSNGSKPPATHPHAREIIEMMARGISTAIGQRQLTDQLAYQAKHDALTGLPNRLMLTERLTAALANARAAGSLVAVAFIDLDMFKQINDTLGHAVGDRVLQEVASRLAACIEQGDTLARMGGDEFTAVLTGIRTEEDAIEYSRRLLGAVKQPCRVDEYELFVTASVGLSFFPQDAQTPLILLRNADAAMYVAKYRGKNEVHCYRAEVTATARQRLDLETHLRRALERREFRLLYQPQVTPDRKLAALEVLLVWEHPEMGRIAPMQFIPIAEETGLILQIGSWVVEEACRTVAGWERELGRRVPVAVNVSAIQFAQANFVDTVRQALTANGLSAGGLELELTESLVMRDVEQATEIMRQLTEFGVAIAIDDFGTGYSSLSYLKQLPAQIVKLDASFLAMENEQSVYAVVNAVAALGHTFGLRVTAEGVETERQFEIVCRAGCDRIQGHLFGASYEPAKIRELLKASESA